MLTSTLKSWSARWAIAVVGAALIAGCSGSNAPTGTTEAPPEGSTETAAAPAEGGTCAPEITQLDFGIISTESQENLEELWEPFLARMSEEIGRPVKGFYATDYAGVIEAMGAGKIQLAWYGGKSYIEAAARSGAEAFAQTVAADGSEGYYAYLITNKENPLLAKVDVKAGNGDKVVLENAANLTFAFNDPNSTSGYLVPFYYVFSKNGVDPEEAFKQVLFSGSHEATAQAVANNQVDVATNNSESLARLKESDAEAFEKIQVIWTSPIIPSDPIAWKSDIPDCLKEELKDFFYNITDETVLGPLAWKGFKPADDSGWNTIRELEVAKQMEEVKNDAALSETDKTAKLAELQKQLDALK